MSADGSYAFTGTPSHEQLAKFDLNDLGNAYRLIMMVGGLVDTETGEIELASATLLYLREIGWIGWNKRHWDQKLGQRLAEQTAHKVAQGLVQQKPWLPGEKKEVNDFIKSSGNAGRIAAMLKVAESYLQVDLDEFDQDPLALNVRNGTLKFKPVAGDGMDVDFRPHDPKDRITRMAAVTYEPDARCPKWDLSMKFWQPDDAMREWQQRKAGYIATGYTHEQAFFIEQGKGRDGKSTYVGALRELMGDYADVADVRTFLDTGQRGGADASPDLARLAGDCRLVSVAEPPRGAKLAEAMIKSFTGGAPILARRLRQDLFSFTPQPKVVMECNSRPVIRGDDEGIWRRIRLSMWEHQLTKAEVDRSLPATLRAEYSGILNWMIAGVAAYLAFGLAEPERVTAAMDDYRKGSSPFGEWFMERVELAPEAQTPAAWFYSDYKEWCDGQGIEKPMSQRAFGDALADRQIIRCARGTGGIIRRQGAKLRPKDAFAQPTQDGAGVGDQRGGEPFDPEQYEGFR